MGRKKEVMVRDIERIVMEYLFGKNSVKGYMAKKETRGDNNYVLASVFPNTDVMEETIQYGKEYGKINKKRKLYMASKRKVAKSIKKIN